MSAETVTRQHFDQTVGELKAMIAGLLPAQSGADEEIILTKDAMKFMCYSDADTFLRAVKRDGVPFIRINARRIGFEMKSLRAWKQKRTRNSVT